MQLDMQNLCGDPVADGLIYARRARWDHSALLRGITTDDG